MAGVVAQVGGDQIDLVPLIPIGSDLHSFVPTPQDLITLNQADVIFINGLHLEEPLLPVLTSLDNAAHPDRLYWRAGQPRPCRIADPL